MKYINQSEIDKYLKRNIELALFVGIGEYFEDKTFDWLKISFNGNIYKVQFIQSFDEGNEMVNSISDFSTVNDLEIETGGAEIKSIEGQLLDCIAWITKNYNCDLSLFVKLDSLNEIYAGLVEKGELGR